MRMPQEAALIARLAKLLHKLHWLHLDLGLLQSAALIALWINLLQQAALAAQ